MEEIVSKVLKEDFSNLEREYVTVTVDLNYTDKKNINGWRMPYCKVKEALESAIAKSLLQTGNLIVSDGYQYEKHIRLADIPFSNIIGYVNSIDIKNRKAVVRMTKKYKEETYDKFDMCLSIAWLGTIKDGLCLDPRIAYTAMTLKSGSAYK